MNSLMIFCYFIFFNKRKLLLDICVCMYVEFGNINIYTYIYSIRYIQSFYIYTKYLMYEFPYEK